MSQPRPDQAKIAAALTRADSAVAAAAACRARYHRRRAPKRDSALAAARNRCAEAAAPLRSWLGMAAWGGISLDDELLMKKATTALRYERRQIDKML